MDDIDYVRQFAEQHGYDVNSIYKILGIRYHRTLMNEEIEVGKCFKCGDDRVRYVRIIIKNVNSKKPKILLYWFCMDCYEKK